MIKKPFYEFMRGGLVTYSTLVEPYVSTEFSWIEPFEYIFQFPKDCFTIALQHIKTIAQIFQILLAVEIGELVL
jgi:hypothetical protein